MSIAPLLVSYARPQRLVNALGAYGDYRLSIALHKPLVKHFPPALMIEPTNICNLSCPLCPSGNNSLKRERGMMSLDRFQRIVKQVAPHIGMLILWNQGEPYLNPDFYAMTELCTKLGFYSMTSTNASLKLDIPRIVKSGLNKIIISMDGISAQTYNEYRINGNFELVLQNMKALLEEKKRQKKRTPELVWQFIVMSHNEHEVPKVRSLAHKMGIDKLELKTVQIYTEDDKRFLPQNEASSRYKLTGKAVELKTELLNRCRRLWTQPVINWDGEMSVCCYDKDLSIPIGNIDNTSFQDLWFGQSMQEMRKAVLKNRAAFEICRNCGEGIVQKLK